MTQISDLKPNPKNPRKISPKKLEMLKKSVIENGDLGGIIFNTRTQTLIGGHQRAKVLPEDAQITYFKKYPSPTESGTTAIGFVEINGEMFFYREVDVDPVKAEVLLLAANKQGGEWDFSMLPDFLLGLDAQLSDEEIEETGFENWEIENIMAGVKVDDPDLSDLDDAEEKYTISVKCDTELDFKMLQSKLDISGKKVSAKKLLEVLS